MQSHKQAPIYSQPNLINMHTTADLYDAHSGQVQVLTPALRHFGQNRQFSGYIVTLKLFEDNTLVRDTLGQNGDGRVLVVDGGGSLRCALLGDNIAQLAVDNGWAGVVIFGCIRDSAVIGTMPIGVMALSTNPTKSVKRSEGQINIPLHFLGAHIHPNHWIAADEDGILVSATALNG